MFMGMVCCLWVFDCCLEEILFQSFEGNKGNNKITELRTILQREMIYDFKIEVVPLIINFSTELTTVVKFEVYVQK